MPREPGRTQPPPSKEVGDEVTGLVRAVYRHAGAVAAEMAGQASELHPTDHNAIRLLDHAADRPVTVGDLGRDLHLSSASVSEMVDRLERAGFVVRQRDPADRRRVLVVLTDRSRTMAMGVLEPLIARLDQAVRDRSDAQLAEVAGFLRDVLGSDAPPDPTRD